MPESNVYIVGAGGHAKVVIDILEKQDKFFISGVLDDNPALHGKIFFGYPVLGDHSYLRGPERTGSRFTVAIGNNRIRQDISDELIESGAIAIRAIHPSVQISRNVTILSGTVVMASCVINADTLIEQNVIVNSRASIDHDCLIGAAVHIAPGVTICGGVRVGRGSLIGAGATIAPGLAIGTNVVVGTGAVVIDNIPDGQTVVGIPARPIADK